MEFSLLNDKHIFMAIHGDFPVNSFFHGSVTYKILNLVLGTVIYGKEGSPNLRVPVESELYRVFCPITFIPRLLIWRKEL